jgi:acetoin utilization deacetylase AcuC-like enzyme
MGPGGDRIARLAAGGAVAAVEAVIAGQVPAAYAMIRPPGHHAIADQSMGYCVFNNVAIAVRQAQQNHGVRRVMVVDWDVHHGNGTQAIFFDDPDVLFVSLHQDDLYPQDSGTLQKIGGRGAEGLTVNIPLPAGLGNAGYRSAFEQVVLPVGRSFSPELIVISAGQDACISDPLGRMSLTTAGYRWMTSALVELAAEVAGGRLVVCQEGGYAPEYSPYCSAVIAETLAGYQPSEHPIGEPYGQRAETMPASRTVGLDGAAAIDRALAVYAEWWECLI